MFKKRNGSRHFQKKVINYIKKRLENIQNSEPPDYPDIIDRNGRKEREIVIRDFCHGETVEHVFTLYGANDINIDQYLIYADGKQMFINRQGRDVLNQTRKRKVMGWTRAGNFAISQFVRVGRHDE